jgi:hypothetical protein
VKKEIEGGTGFPIWYKKHQKEGNDADDDYDDLITNDHNNKDD